MTTTTSPNEFEVSIDTQLSDLMVKRAEARYYRDSAVRSLGYALGHRTETLRRNLTITDLLAQAEGNESRRVRDAVESITKYQDKMDAIQAQETPLNEQYTGWSRFFLCTNHNGHIHRDMNCSTCRWDTEFAWLPEMSGLTEKDAVEAYGCILCSVCFPSAPVEWTNGTSKADQAAKDERAAAKAARDAAKAEKSITNPDGTPVEGKWGTIATLVTARRELTDAHFNLLLGYQPARYLPFIDTLVAAIAFKTGEDADAIRADAKAKAAKKYKKEMS
jgi:hypothetical protein